MDNILDCKGSVKLVICIIVILIALIGVFFGISLQGNIFDESAYEESICSEVYAESKHFEDFSGDVFVERAKNISDKIKFGQSKDDVLSVVGKWTDTDEMINEYSYHLTNKYDFYMGNKYTFRFDSNDKLLSVQCYSIATLPTVVSDVLKPNVEDISLVSKELKKNMTFEEVKGIIGDAYLLDQFFKDSNGKEKMYYSWFDKKGEEMKLIFEEGRLLFVRKIR